MSNYIYSNTDAEDTSTSDSDGGYSQVLGGAGTVPKSGGIATGPIGQQIGQKISGGAQGATPGATPVGGSNPTPSPQWPYSTSTGNGNITTSTGNAGTATTNGSMYTTASTNNGLITSTVTWNAINSLSKPQPFTKTKTRYVVVRADKTTLELQELNTITPQEMIGITKFLGLVTTYTVLILGQALVSYNFNIKWSEVINSLGIAKHFADGKALSDYENDNSEVLDILLYDPQ